MYIAPVNQPDQRKRISTGGGTTPRWSRDSRELFYASADNRAIMRVQVKAGSTLTTSLPTRLCSIGESPAARDVRRNTILEGLAYFSNQTGEIRLGNERRGPEMFVQLVFRERARSILDEDFQQLERFGREMYLGTTAK